MWLVAFQILQRVECGELQGGHIIQKMPGDDFAGKFQKTERGEERPPAEFGRFPVQKRFEQNAIAVDQNADALFIPFDGFKRIGGRRCPWDLSPRDSGDGVESGIGAHGGMAAVRRGDGRLPRYGVLLRDG